MFVDASDDERTLFELRFAAECAALATVASADEALAIVARGETDLVITDIALPGCDGRTLVGRLRTLAPEVGGFVPVIAATGWGTPGDRAKLAAAGFAGYVGKPYDAAALRAVVARVVPLVEHLGGVRARCHELRARLEARCQRIEDEHERLAIRDRGAARREAGGRSLTRRASREPGARARAG